MGLLFETLLPNLLLSQDQQKVTSVRIPAAIFSGSSVRGQSQCFPKVSALRNSPEHMLNADSQALALVIH